MVRFTSALHGTSSARWTKGAGDLRSEFDLKFIAPAEVSAGFYALQGTARGAATFDGGTRLQFQEASFHTERSTLTARGSLGARTAALEFQLTTTDFEEWRPLAEYLAATSPLPVTLRAPLHFTGTLAGSLEQPEYAGELTAGAFTFRESEWDNLRASVSGSSAHMGISSGLLEHGTSSIRFSGSVTLAAGRVDPSGPAALKVQLERSQLAGLREALGVRYRIAGVATGNLELAGPLDRLTGSGQGRIEQGEFEGENFDSLSASLRVEEAVWHIEQIRLAKGPGRLSGYARIHPAERGFAAELYGQDFSLAEFRHLEPIRKPDRPSLDARAGFELRAGGTFEKPHVLAVWNLGSLRVGETPIGFLGGRLDWQGELLRVEGHFLGEGGTVDFTGSARTADDWPAELNGRYENLRADPWMRMLMTPKFNPQVGLSGTITLRGPLKRPEELELRARAERFEIVFPQPEPEQRDIVTRPDLPEVTIPELAWKSEEPVDFRFQKDNLTISRFRLRGPSTDLVVEGSLRTGALAALALEIQGSADATLLSLFDPALQASGNSELRVRVGGTLADPLVFGTIGVQNVSLRYEDLPLRFTNLRGEIALEGERATIRGLRGMGGGGRIALSGFISLGTASRFDARLELDEVRIPYPAPFTSVLDGNLRLLGSPDQGQLSGELIVRQLFASEDFGLLRVVEEAGRRAAEAAPTVHSPLAEKIRMNIQVRAAPAVRLETRDLRLVADLDLRVQGTLATPVEVGTIHFLSGETVFRGNRYKVVRGDLSMTNPFRTERQLDLEVQTRVQRYDLWVDLSGPLDRLRLSYRSDPPLPTTDILSLLAFGYARGEEGIGTTAAGQSVQTVGASALLSEALSSQVSGRIQRIFGVSRIRVDPNVGTLGPSGGARVTVEQQVTRDFTLTYVTTTASSSQQRIIQFEWILSESVAMVGVRDHNGILGFELRWRQRFK
jgi:translocation and assembly module TamB